MNESTGKWIKVGVISGLVLIIITAIILVKYQYDQNERSKMLEQSLVEMKQLPDGIVRSEAKYVTAEDLEKTAKEMKLNLEVIKKDLQDSFNAEIRGLNTTVVVTPGSTQIGIPSSSTKPNPNPVIPAPVCNPDGTCTNPDLFGYLNQAQLLKLTEPFNQNLTIPFGEATFKAWEEKPWDLMVYPRNYRVATILGQDEEGRHYTYNKFQVETQGKVYDIPITSSKFEEVIPEPKFHVNPKLHLTVGGGVITNPIVKPEFVPSLQVFTFSYGRTKKIEDTQWSFLGLGVGIETTQGLPSFLISPAKYNLGYAIPFISNLHIGPSVGIDIKGQFSVLGEISVAL